MQFPNFPSPLLRQCRWLLVCMCVLASCAAEKSTTVITANWKDPEARKYKSFLVVVLNKKYAVRGTLEADIAKLLKKEGVEAAKSVDVLGKDEKIETTEEKRAAIDKIKGLGYDAIIAVTVLRSTDEKRYVPGTSSRTAPNIGQGSGYYDPRTGANQQAGGTYAFGTYYMTGSTAYNTPGYYETDKIYFVQSNVYETVTEKLIWSAQSETFYPGNLAAASRDFSMGMVDAMKSAGIIVVQQ